MHRRLALLLLLLYPFVSLTTWPAVPSIDHRSVPNQERWDKLCLRHDHSRYGPEQNNVITQAEWHSILIDSGKAWGIPGEMIIRQLTKSKRLSFWAVRREYKELYRGFEWPDEYSPMPEDLKRYYQQPVDQKAQK